MPNLKKKISKRFFSVSFFIWSGLYHIILLLLISYVMKIKRQKVKFPFSKYVYGSLLFENLKLLFILFHLVGFSSLNCDLCFTTIFYR